MLQCMPSDLMDIILVRLDDITIVHLLQTNKNFRYYISEHCVARRHREAFIKIRHRAVARRLINDVVSSLVGV